MICVNNGKEFLQILEAMSKINIAPKEQRINEERPVTKLVIRNGSIQFISVTSKVHTAFKLNCTMEEKDCLSIELDGIDAAKKISSIIEKDKNLMMEMNQNHNLLIRGNGALVMEPVEPKNINFKVIQSPPSTCFLAGDLVKAIKCLSLALDNNNEVMGKVKVDFNVEDATLKLTSFNGTLMCVYDVPLEDIDDTQKSFSGLIEGKVLKSVSELIELVKNETMDLIVEKNLGYIGLSCGDLKVTMPLLQGDFINCNALLNEAFPQTATFNIKKLKATLISMAKVNKGTLSIETKDSTGIAQVEGLTKDIQPLQTNGMKISVPLETLKSLISVIDDSNVRILSTVKGLIKVCPETSEDVLFITTACKESPSSS